MRSIERRFIATKKKLPFAGDVICFTEAVRDQGFSREILHEWFNKLVKKDEYDTSYKKELLAYIREQNTC